MLLNSTAALYSNSINHIVLAAYWTALHCTALHFTGLDWLVVCDTRQHNPTHISHTGSLHTLHITPFHCVSQLWPGYLVRQLTPSRARQLTSVLAAITAAMLTVLWSLFTVYCLPIIIWSLLSSFDASNSHTRTLQCSWHYSVSVYSAIPNVIQG